MKNNITAILVDDESNCRDVLKELLGKFAPDIYISGEAEDVEGAYSLIERTNPKLVFLDIQMPRASGFSLLQRYREVPFAVVFVTSFDKYAINAIKFSALDYLLKPVEVGDLKDAVQKARKAIQLEKNSSLQVINLLNNLNKDSQDHKIAVHTGDNVRLLDSDSIVYIEAEGRYCNIYTTKDERLTTARYLKDFEEYFEGNSFFVRIHKSFLLNIKKIRSYSKGEPCVVEMNNGKRIEVARRKKQEILEILKK